MKKLIFIFTSLIVIISLFKFSSLSFGIRFEETKYNYLFVLIFCVLLPFSLFLSSLFIEKKARKVSLLIISALTFVPCLITFYFANITYQDILKNNVNLEFEKISEVKLGKSKYRLYLKNGGATTSFGLVIRKETSILMGLNFVKIIYSKYPSSSKGYLKSINKNLIELKTESYEQLNYVEIIQIKIVTTHTVKKLKYNLTDLNHNNLIVVNS